MKEQSWGSRDAAKIAGVHFRTMMRWLDLLPDLQWVPGSSQTGRVVRWRLRDLVTVRAIHDLRRDKGVSMQQLRKAARYVHHQGGDLHRLYSLGRDLVLYLGEGAPEADALISALSVPGQGIMRRLILWDREAVAHELRERADNLEQERAA